MSFPPRAGLSWRDALTERKPAMLHPYLAQAMAAEQRKDRIAHAAAVSRAHHGARCAEHPQELPFPGCCRCSRPALRPRAALPGLPVGAGQRPASAAANSA